MCREVDPDLFFPEKGRVDQVADAVAVCGRCPVRAACLDAALRLPVSVDYGVWGGTTANERRYIRDGGALHDVGGCSGGPQ